MDQQTTIEDLKLLIKKFTQERDWDKFLFPKTISMYLSLEAAELLEKFVWVDNNESKQLIINKRKEIQDELADVMYWILQMCWIYEIDLSDSLQQKLKQNIEKYPVNKSKNTTLKYTEL